MEVKITWVAGARPNFMKVAPIWRAMQEHNVLNGTNSIKFNPILVHTGQHYDKSMSKIFFKELGLPSPHYYLGVGSGSHAEQTARVMIEFEKILEKERPNMVGVVGDVNSTVACALTTKKSYVLPEGKTPILIHVEAGLRSGDWLMPEEINRIVTDNISDMLFTSEESGNNNLIREGIHSEKVHFVGNVMIDSLYYILDRTNVEEILEKFGLTGKTYGLVTIHRPSNVDFPNRLKNIMEILENIGREVLLLFPAHPRTVKNLREMDWHKEGEYQKNNHGIQLLPPLGYKEFIALMSNAAFVITDSGGIQEETTALRVPCLTLRKNTERPVTVEIGTNKLLGGNLETLYGEIRSVLKRDVKKGEIPPLWDGKTAKRIISIIQNEVKGRN